MGIHEIAELLGQPVYGDLENYYIPCPLAASRHPSGQNPGSSFSLKSVRVTDAVGYCWSCGWVGNMNQLADAFDAVGDYRASNLRALVGKQLSCDQLHALLEREELQMAKAKKKVVTLPASFKSIEEGQWTRCPFEVQTAYGVMWEDHVGPICIVRDTSGEVVGWQYRNLGYVATDKKSPKYLNNDGYKRGMHVYGLHLANGRDTVVVSEGASDAHAIAAVRPDVCSVSTFGAAVGITHLKQLAALFKHVVIAFDNDSAGQKGMTKALLLLANYPQFESVRVMTYGGLASKDPEELGSVTLKKFLDEAVLVEYTSDTGEDEQLDLIPDELDDDESSFDGDDANEAI